MQAHQTAPSENFAEFKAALELPAASPHNRNVESQNGVHSVSDSGLGTVSDGEFDAIESPFTKLDNFEMGQYREGAGLKLEADGLGLSVLRPWESRLYPDLATGCGSIGPQYMRFAIDSYCAEFQRNVRIDLPMVRYRSIGAPPLCRWAYPALAGRQGCGSRTPA
jgi:hypothetical protein